MNRQSLLACLVTMRGSKQPFEFLTHLDHEGGAPPCQDSQQQKKPPPQLRQQQQQQQQRRQTRVQQQQQQLQIHKERSHETDCDENDSGGVFAMTGIGEEVTVNNKEKKSRNTTTLRSKLFTTVSLR